MGDKLAPLNKTSWYSSAWLIGEAALAFKEHSLALFPIPAVSPQVIALTLAPPEPLKTPMGDRLFRQRVDMCCRAEPVDLKALTEPPLNALADLLAFHTLRPVAVQQGPFTTAPPQVSLRVLTGVLALVHSGMGLTRLLSSFPQTSLLRPLSFLNHKIRLKANASFARCVGSDGLSLPPTPSWSSQLLPLALKR